jgi:hypothetical protein
MNSSRTKESQPVSPASGIRSRVGHVVRWHAEPLTSEDSAESSEPRETRDARTAQTVSQPL